MAARVQPGAAHLLGKASVGGQPLVDLRQRRLVDGAVLVQPAARRRLWQGSTRPAGAQTQLRAPAGPARPGGAAGAQTSVRVRQPRAAYKPAPARAPCGAPEAVELGLVPARQVLGGDARHDGVPLPIRAVPPQDGLAQKLAPCAARPSSLQAPGAGAVGATGRASTRSWAWRTCARGGLDLRRLEGLRAHASKAATHKAVGGPALGAGQRLRAHASQDAVHDAVADGRGQAGPDLRPGLAPLAPHPLRGPSGGGSLCAQAGGARQGLLVQRPAQSRSPRSTVGDVSRRSLGEPDLKSAPRPGRRRRTAPTPQGSHSWPWAARARCPGGSAARTSHWRCGRRTGCWPTSQGPGANDACQARSDAWPIGRLQAASRQPAAGWPAEPAGAQPGSPDRGDD